MAQIVAAQQVEYARLVYAVEMAVERDQSEQFVFVTLYKEVYRVDRFEIFIVYPANLALCLAGAVDQAADLINRALPELVKV